MLKKWFWYQILCIKNGLWDISKLKHKFSDDWLSGYLEDLGNYSAIELEYKFDWAGMLMEWKAQGYNIDNKVNEIYNELIKNNNCTLQIQILNEDGNIKNIKYNYSAETFKHYCLVTVEKLKL